MQDDGWQTLRVERDKVSREGWEPGPWDSEPDAVLWLYRGLKCFIWRHDQFGALNGYVAIGRTHPYFLRDERFVTARVHGGVTFAGPLWPATGAANEAVWWIGFDTGHGFDTQPGLRARVPGLRDLPALVLDDGFRMDGYRTLGYVRRKTEALADQVLARQKIHRREQADRINAILRTARKQLVRAAGAATRHRDVVQFARISAAEIECSKLPVRVPRSLRALPKKVRKKEPVQ